ncbi:MAG: hypothetical protein Q9174_006583, partial [Haloplaca sp. 1 TL-2023]
ADNLITISDEKFHARVRGLMSNLFTEESLRTQYPLIMHHADELVFQLRRRATISKNQAKGARVNLTDWLIYLTMDIIGDLALGEPFGCLEKGEYHPWVATVFSYLKGMSLAAATRFYPALEFLFNWMIPKSVIEGQKRHAQYANLRINRRLDMKTNRPDFITPFMRSNVDFENMSRDEILSTFNFIIVGGSETTATTLTGIFNHLSKNKPVLDRLSDKIRSKLANRTFTINRSTRYFTNPDRFIPERWLSPEEKPTEYKNDQLTASKPFSIGFHRCLGQPLAWVELRLVVIKLLWAFDLEEDSANIVHFDQFPVIMLIQKEPMMMWLKARPGVEYKRPYSKEPMTEKS